MDTTTGDDPGEMSVNKANGKQQAGTNGAPPRLRSLYIYLTNECNQACAHCWINPTLEGRYQGERPDADQYLRFIDAALPLGLGYVKITGGEPLLRKELYPIVRHAASAGVSIGLETNAMLIGRREADFLKQHRVGTSVSLDGASALVHDRRRGLVGAFERTWRALELMTEAGIPLTIVTAVSPSNREEVPKILELLRGLKKSAPLTLKINPVMPVGRARSMARRGDTFGPQELLDLTAQICNELQPAYRKVGIGIILQLELAFFPIDNLYAGAGQMGLYHCGFLNLLSVLADGSITLCGIGYEAPELILGNIRGDYALPTLWAEHPVLQGLRHKVHHALEGVCADCLFQSLCLGGCRAVALAAGGSLTASPPWCQDLYNTGLFPATRLREPAASRYVSKSSSPGAEEPSARRQAAQ